MLAEGRREALWRVGRRGDGPPPVAEVTHSEELMDRVEEIISELVAGRSWSREREVRRKDGTTCPRWTTTPLQDLRKHHLNGGIFELLNQVIVQ